MKPIIVGVLKLYAAIAIFAIASIASYSDTLIGPGGVQAATTFQNLQAVVSGPAIWRIGSGPGIRPLNQFATPMVMPQSQDRTDIGIRSHYPVTSTLIIMPGFDSSYGFTGPMEYYPSVFGLYDGLPEYIYMPSYFITMDSDGNWVFQDIGSYYPYVFDPFQQSTVTISPNGQLGGEVTNALDSFAQDWASGDNSGLTSFVVPSSTVSMGVGDQYEYNMTGAAYLQAASNALQSVTTTDFQYTGVRIKSNGSVLASAMQSYRAPDGSLGRSNIKIVFSPDSSNPKGYRITGFSVQKAN